MSTTPAGTEPASDVAKATGASRGKTRQVLGELLNSDPWRSRIEKLIDEGLSLTHKQWGYCDTCKKKVQLEAPDLKGRVDVLIKLLEQAEGKPRDEDSAGTTIVVHRPPRA